MDLEYTSYQVAFNSAVSTFDEIQKQLEHNKLMNDIWIGIVFTLILISIVFCMCSCFLYHQFRNWKRNYHNTIPPVEARDIEALEISIEIKDSLPEYTIVSGLPSYDVALELLEKTPTPYLIVCPRVCNVFKNTEKSSLNINKNNYNDNQREQLQNIESTTPLLQKNVQEQLSKSPDITTVLKKVSKKLPIHTNIERN